ncbi:hypothetical protein BT69DRAFT_1305308 [Atractiella rhizophila]|nr:hypothetical protein BT69DRAFT_1305308 [Atractiella rhizophila]
MADRHHFHEENEEKREHQRQHPDSDVSSIISTPTPPPRPSESLHLKGKDVPSPPSHAQELGMMLGQLTANGKVYGVGDHESEEFDLALPEGRRDGLKALIALFKYVLSGEAKIGRMKKFAKELKARHHDSEQRR